MAIASDALAAVGDVTMVCEAKLVYIMIVVDVRLHFVVSNFENGHVSIVMSMIYVRFFRTRAFSLVTQVADGCCAAMLPPLSLGASSLINKEKFFHFLQPADRTQGRCRIGMTA